MMAVGDSNLVRMVGISKNFGRVQALREVDFDINRGEIVGMVGDNGAGKSTLIKILSGLYPPNEGEIYFEGRKVKLASPNDARNLGIETIHQDLALVEDLSIPRNIFLNREYVKPFFKGMVKVMDEKRMELEAANALEKINIGVDSVRERVRNLSGGQRQAVAVARAIYFNAKVLIMDEPTAALGLSESAAILSLMKEVRGKGAGVIFITHNLHHIFNVADRITVLYRGRIVGNVYKKDTSMEEVGDMILGEIVTPFKGIA